MTGRRIALLSFGALLAGALGLKKNAVTVAAGRSSARKRVEVVGLTHDEIVRRLGGA